MPTSPAVTGIYVLHPNIDEEMEKPLPLADLYDLNLGAIQDVVGQIQDLMKAGLELHEIGTDDKDGHSLLEEFAESVQMVSISTTAADLGFWRLLDKVRRSNHAMRLRVVFLDGLFEYNARWTIEEAPLPVAVGELFLTSATLRRQNPFHIKGAKRDRAGRST